MIQNKYIWHFWVPFTLVQSTFSSVSEVIRSSVNGAYLASLKCRYSSNNDILPKLTVMLLCLLRWLSGHWIKRLRLLELFGGVFNINKNRKRVRRKLLLILVEIAIATQ